MAPAALVKWLSLQRRDKELAEQNIETMYLCQFWHSFVSRTAVILLLYRAQSRLKFIIQLSYTRQNICEY